MSNLSSDESLPALLTAATPDVRHSTRSRIAQRKSLGHSFLKDASLTRQLFTPKADMSTPGMSQRIISSGGMAIESPNTSGLINTSHATHFQTMLDDHLTMDMSGSVLGDADLEDISKKVFDDFQGFYRCYTSENEVFELLESYEQVCSDFVTLLSRASQLTAPNKQSQSCHLQNLLVMERNTWRLARVLFQDRLVQDGLDNDMDIQGSRFHDAQIVENLYKRDSEVRQCQLVIDWLERNEAEDVTENSSKCIVDSKVAWENTFHALQRRTKNPNQVQMRAMVNEMDPDAPTRQNAPLHDLDWSDEGEFFGKMFSFIRKGQLDRAQRYAEQCGYFWLSVAMDGWRLHKDPNLNAPSRQDLQPMEGNPSRDIWKAHCWKIIEKGLLNTYESAIYASLSGNLRGLLPVCYSWEDSLWAHIKCLLDAKIDDELQMCSQLKRAREDLPPPAWNSLNSLEQIFQDLKASSLQKIRDQCDSPHHLVQKHIILNSINDVIEEMYRLVSHQLMIPSNHLVRFCAHFVLFLRIVGLSTNEDLCVHILKAFVQVLVNEKQTPLIATYTATLPPKEQVIVYAQFLEGVREHSDRKHCLELAEESGLDVQRITKSVVENIRNRQDSALTGQPNHLMSETTQEDQEKIEAIDWLTFLPEQRAEAMKQANALMRVFVASQKLEAAEKVMGRLPADSIAVISRHWKRTTGSDELAPDEDSICREYLCFQAYLQALESFNDWFRIFHQGKPMEPSKPEGESTRFTDWVAFEHRSKQFQADLDRWKQSVAATTKVARDKLYNVLLFPDGGWMVDQNTLTGQNPVDACRDQQMSLLRHLCIPQMCSLLHKVFHDSGNFTEALQIADIIASEKNQLYLEFTKEEMKTFLLKLRESSLELLDQNLDPLGYPFE